MHVAKYKPHEVSFRHTGDYANPYRECEGNVVFSPPNGERRQGCLFWDGDDVWRFRIAPDVVGPWSWRVYSPDDGLNGRSGTFDCVESEYRGGICRWEDYPDALRYQNGEPCWVFGDTNWAYTNTHREKRCNHATVKAYADRRASQGFNLINIKLQAWGENEGGYAWQRHRADDSIDANEPLNPAFWREVDDRLIYLDRLGITAFLYIAWQKSDSEAQLVSWDKFPGHEARLRFIRYVAARYAAMNTMFCIAGEWKPGRGAHLHGDTRASVAALGEAFRKHDPHQRLLCVHGGGRGTTHPWFAQEPWCDLADCQQVYYDRHAEILLARAHNKPVLNAEYGYWQRKFHDGIDGPAGMRAITWEIAMAKGFFVTGWGSTYFGGFRHPTPFGCDADSANDLWDEQVVHLKSLFERIPWWRMTPHDELILGEADHAYCLAERDGCHVSYIMGVRQLYMGVLGTPEEEAAALFNPRTGGMSKIGIDVESDNSLRMTLPDKKDWIVIVQAGPPAGFSSTRA